MAMQIGAFGLLDGELLTFSELLGTLGICPKTVIVMVSQVVRFQILF